MGTKVSMGLRSRYPVACVLALVGLLGCTLRADINQQVARLDIDAATLKDVTGVFGKPAEIRWGNKILDVSEIPAANYCLCYAGGFSIWMTQDKLVELRFESPDLGYVWKGRLRVGMPLEQVLAVLGQPARTVEGGENLFADRVLYKDIKGRKGHCYYAQSDQRLRLWFSDNKLGALYLTRSDYERRFGSRELDLAELPATSIIDEKGHIVDKVDYPFVDDPSARGYWESVDFVRDIEDFVPGQKQFGGDLFLKELYILPEGRTNWAFAWTAGLILHNGDKTASKYLLQDRDGQTYIFLEWKSGDYTIRHQRPSYYVLKKGPDRPYVETRVTDKIDYPFVDDPGLVGVWKSVDFVDTPDQFDPDHLRWQGDLFLKELVFLPEGKTPHPWQTWTKGLIIHHGDQTASEYQIKEINGQTYLFFQWKSGDYTLRGMKPHYYVLKR